MPATRDHLEHQLSLILDATVLSNFALIGRLRLLERLYAGAVCTTLTVVEEIRQGINAGYAGLEAIDGVLAPLQSDGWLIVLTPESGQEQASYVSLIASLGPGEASCLAIAGSRGMTLATDDRAARRRAAKLAVPVTGTIGILIRSVRDGHLSLPDANGVLRQMIQQGYRSPVQDLDALAQPRPLSRMCELPIALRNQSRESSWFRVIVPGSSSQQRTKHEAPLATDH